MPGSIGEDFGMIGRRTKKLEKSSLELESEGTRAVLDLHCKINMGRVDQKEELLTMLNTARVRFTLCSTRAVFDP